MKPISNFLRLIRYLPWFKANIIIGLLLFQWYGAMAIKPIPFQQNNINIRVNNEELKRVLQEIEKQSNYRFVYNETLVDVTQKLSIVSENKPIDNILKEISKKTGIRYTILNQQIVLMPPTTSENPIPEAIKVVGTVFDETNAPLIGVSVTVKGDKIGTITDIYGKYELEVPSNQSVLVFSFIGYVSQEITVGNQTEINISLKENVIGIETVVVVGYATTSKKLITGSVGNIDSDELRQSASNSVEGALQGKTTGVQILQNSGTPGSAISVLVRGTASIYSGTQPLYVVDGVPITTGNYSQIGFGGQGIDASMDINPNTIESITVLKDASAAAIYGARAANGVILITTKKGAAGNSTISYRSYLGYQKEWKRLDLMNANEWSDYVRTFNPDFIDRLNSSFNTDWQEEVFTIAPMTSHELSMSGGSDKTQAFVSAGYLNQQGIVIGTGYEKYSIQANMDHKITNRLSLAFRNSFSYSINNRVRGDEEIDGVLPNAISMPPVYPVYDELGNYDENGYFSNPVATANESTTRAITNRNISSLSLNFQINENTHLRNQWGYDYYDLHERRIEPTTTRAGAETNGMIIEGRSNVGKLSQQLIFDNTLTFGNHSINSLLGYSFELDNKRYSYIYATNFPSVYPEYINSAGTINEASTDAVDEAISSFFGRVKYNFADKYLWEFSVRADGSSKFGSNNRYAVLPATSVAWRIIEESFMKNQSIFSDLKLKLGYGFTGNDKIGNNRYQNLYITGRNYNNLPGLVPKQIPNPDLRWESTANFNAGLDMEFMKGKIGLNLEYYNNQTKDLLLPRPLPGSSGFTSYITNVGRIENKGFEFTLNTQNIDKTFKWNSSFNLSFNRNKVLELYNNQPIYSDSRGKNAIMVGQPIAVFYMYESLGVDPSTGDLVLVDVDGDKQITDKDRLVVGNPNPDFTGGFTNTFKYKNIDLRVFMQFSYGNDIYNGTRRYLENNSYGESDNQLATVLTQWRNPGDITQIPRFEGKYNNWESTRYMEDGSYLRIKEVTLGYNFTPKALERLKPVSSVRFYLKAQNLFTFTNYSGLDPEVNYDGEGVEFGKGTDFFTFPHPRSIILGINLDF